MNRVVVGGEFRQKVGIPGGETVGGFQIAGEYGSEIRDVIHRGIGIQNEDIRIEPFGDFRRNDVQHPVFTAHGRLAGAPGIDSGTECPADIANLIQGVGKLIGADIIDELYRSVADARQFIPVYPKLLRPGSVGDQYESRRHHQLQNDSSEHGQGLLD